MEADEGGVSAFHAQAQWRRLRTDAKRRDGWRCVVCGSRLRLEVDHVEPVERRPELALSLDNLQTLCRAHHIEKTAAETERKMDPERKRWRAAVNSILSSGKV